MCVYVYCNIHLCYILDTVYWIQSIVYIYMCVSQWSRAHGAHHDERLEAKSSTCACIDREQSRDRGNELVRVCIECGRQQMSGTRQHLIQKSSEQHHLHSARRFKTRENLFLKFVGVVVVQQIVVLVTKLSQQILLV